jgi:4-hydroxy-tetrahydrodipicolinate synthase
MLRGEGIFAMSVTPFTEEGTLDEARLRTHLRFMADGGVDGVFVCSQGSGEGDLLTRDEKLAIYAVAADELKGRVPVYAAGVGLASSTADIASLAAGAGAAGVDAVYVLGPRHNPLRGPELEDYYHDVIDSINVPAILASNQYLMGYAIPVPVIERLVDHYGDKIEAVLVVDNAGPLLAATARLADSVGGRVQIRCGMLPLLPAAYALGATGCLCFEPNLAPVLVADMWRALRADDAPAFRTRFRQVLDLAEACATYSNPRSIKEAMTILGMPAGPLRRPYQGLDEASRTEFAARLATLHLR